jgi:hypothetical protein
MSTLQPEAYGHDLRGSAHRSSHALSYLALFSSEYPLRADPAAVQALKWASGLMLYMDYEHSYNYIHHLMNIF